LSKTDFFYPTFDQATTRHSGEGQNLSFVGAGFSREGSCKGESFPAKAGPAFDIASFIPLSVNAKH